MLRHGPVTSAGLRRHAVAGALRLLYPPHRLALAGCLELLVGDAASHDQVGRGEVEVRGQGVHSGHVGGTFRSLGQHAADPSATRSSETTDHRTNTKVFRIGDSVGLRRTTRTCS